MGKWVCLENATIIQIRDNFENGKPDIFLKKVKGFNIKRTSFKILISEKSFKLGIVVLVILYNIVFIVIVFTLNMQGRDPNNLVFQFVPISDTQC